MICVMASSGSCRPILLLATINTPAIVAMAFLLVRISPISFHIRSPHDAIIRRISEAGSSHKYFLEPSGAVSVPGFVLLSMAV